MGSGALQLELSGDDTSADDRGAQRPHYVFYFRKLGHIPLPIDIIADCQLPI
jgi:hypothetical protein